MKITKRQLRRIISESIAFAGGYDTRIANIEQLIYDGEYGLADANLEALRRGLKRLEGDAYENALKEYYRLDRMLQIHSAV